MIRINHQQSVTGLKFAAGVAIVFGLVSAVSALPVLAGPQNFVLEIIRFDFSGESAVTSDVERLLSAILGGVLCGWGVLIWRISADWYVHASKPAGRAVLISATTWFVVDSTASVIAGSAFNIVPNTGFYMMFALPVILCENTDQMREIAKNEGKSIQ